MMRVSSSKTISRCFTGLLIGILLFHCSAVFSQPLASTVLDDLFLLDSPAPTHSKLKAPPAVPTKPDSVVNKRLPPPQNEGIAYLASTTTTAGISAMTSPADSQWQPFSSTTPSNTTRPSTEISPQALLQITRSSELLLALQRMNATPQSRHSLSNLYQRGGRVVFKNLSELGSQYATFDALAWLSKDPATQGAWVLFIAEKHRKAPPEALASLITHEAMHADFQNSYCEEEHAWLAEVTAWKQFKAQNPTLQHIPKGWFALVDRLNTIETALAQQTLKAMIRNNPGYAGLQEASPYFRYSPFSMPTDTHQPPSSVKSVMTASPNNSLLQQQSAIAIPSKKPAIAALNPKPFPVAANGRPKLTLRPLRTW
jgi:hypothetical protein